MVSKKNSIYFRLAKLMILSAVIAFAFFWIISAGSDELIIRYFEKTDYVVRQSEKRFASLQEYVEENGLKTNDSAELTEWVTRQRVVTLMIYKNNRLMYDSAYPDEQAIEENEEEYDFYDWQSYYTMNFADGEAEVLLYGFYEYQFYTYAQTVELLLSFGVFLICVMIGIRGTMKYISALSSEIKILEGGDLNYAITVKGKDELSVLAEGLDDMRKSFRQHAETEAYLSGENKRIITEMSHDLRTPLTSILLYVEILQNRKYTDEEQLWSYLDKIGTKAHQMKQLADNIFEYARISQEKELCMVTPQDAQTLFYDHLSEMVLYLEQNGYRVKMQEQFPQGRISVDLDYLNRVFDNIVSNIMRHGAKTEPVTIQASVKGSMFLLKFGNRKETAPTEMESSHVGLQNVKHMMVQMEGDSRIVEDEEMFQIQLLFPLRE